MMYQVVWIERGENRVVLVKMYGLCCIYFLRAKKRKHTAYLLCNYDCEYNIYTACFCLRWQGS